MRLLAMLLLCGLLEAQGISGGALYWRPTTGGYDYAAIARDRGRDVRRVKPNYHWGFTAGAHMECRCWFMEVEGLYIRSTDSAAIDEPVLLIALLGASAPFAHADLKMGYWNVDLRAGFCLCEALRLFGGVRYVHLLEIQQVDGGEFLRQRLAFKGAGPEVGVAGDCGLWMRLRAVGSLAVAAIIGERQTERFSDVTIVAPSLDARLGLRLERSTCGINFRGELGYRLDHYWNALGLQSGGNFLRLSRTPANFGFAGPYASLSAGF